MKKMGIFFIFILIINGLAFAQTWVAEGDENFNFEYTIITRDQWNRIVKAQEATATGVVLSYSDMAEQTGSRVIQGRRPDLKGYFYFSARMLPKNEVGKLASGFFTSIVGYGNSETGIMLLSFLTTAAVPNSISLRFDWNEYARRFNQLLSIVNDE